MGHHSANTSLQNDQTQIADQGLARAHVSQQIGRVVDRCRCAAAFASSLIPRPAYDRVGLINLRYRYPITVVTQERSDLELQSYLVFVS